VVTGIATVRSTRWRPSAGADVQDLWDLQTSQIGAQAAASALLFYTFRIDAGMPWPIAGLLAMLIAGIGGSLDSGTLGVHAVSARRLMTVVATIGLIVGLASMLTGIYGSATLAFPQYLPSHAMTVGGVSVLESQIIVALFGVGGHDRLYVFFRPQPGRDRDAGPGR